MDDTSRVDLVVAGTLVPRRTTAKYGARGRVARRIVILLDDLRVTTGATLVMAAGAALRATKLHLGTRTVVRTPAAIVGRTDIGTVRW